ncbi:hypothetical protein CQW23_22375 [Capsicum baccatum]|uniref:Pentatricopeptide repeat-containing protein n=1 Tax=Capsicum baccatum TaxID=33114 RepID=A0A2G2W0P5_CAPBA|nr:hypothetical protein CQW23_22375 [Capsicum baccatum]
MTENFKMLNAQKESLVMENNRLIKQIQTLETRLRQNSSTSKTDAKTQTAPDQSSPSPQKMDEKGVHFPLNAKKSTVPDVGTASPVQTLFRELSRSKEPVNALLFYEYGRRNGLEVDRFSFPPLLKAASRGLALREGMEIHGLGCKLGFDDDPFVQTALLGMYANCGKIEDARLVFDKMSQRDIVTWDIMIDGYRQNGLFDDVLVLLEEMRSSNVEPDSRVFTTILSACGKTGNSAIGKVIHGLISDNNIIADSRLLSSLISMYAGCGCMDLAQNLYDKLSQKNLVVSTAMISGYSKVGQVEAARSIFDQMTDKDLVCWSAMISGYAESDQPQEALKLLEEMQASGLLECDDIWLCRERPTSRSSEVT